MELADAVIEDRAHGHTWTQIAAMLGTSRQDATASWPSARRAVPMRDTLPASSSCRVQSLTSNTRRPPRRVGGGPRAPLNPSPPPCLNAVAVLRGRLQDHPVLTDGLRRSSGFRPADCVIPTGFVSLDLSAHAQGADDKNETGQFFCCLRKHVRIRNLRVCLRNMSGDPDHTGLDSSVLPSTPSRQLRRACREATTVAITSSLTDMNGRRSAWLSC